MSFPSVHWLSVILASLTLTGWAVAEDARPQSDEKCVEQCDIESDKCMSDSNGDPDKAQACDDRYTECLELCE